MSITVRAAFLIFNLPDLHAKVFSVIAAANPAKLLVVADGPRSPEEAEICANARQVLERIDWTCALLTKFADRNLGCGPCVSRGLNWVFSQVEEAIILEDDVLPVPSFFDFCQTLLERYRDDERVMHIGGTNVQGGQSRTNYSYYFSKYNHVWAWATWRRAWKYYDYEMKTWPEFKTLALLEGICENEFEVRYWCDIFDKMSSDDHINTWYYQWTYACCSQGGLTALPNVNLTSNLGFRSDATHTTVAGTAYAKPLANLPASDLGGITHPPFVVRNGVADSNPFDFFLGGREMDLANETVRWPARVRRKISNLRTRIDAKT